MCVYHSVPHDYTLV